MAGRARLCETHLAATARQGGPDGVRAAVRLCEHARPASLTELLRAVCAGAPGRREFDALADGYSLYCHTQEVDGLKETASR